MRTKASILGHPIHSMLIPFPIGLLGGAFFFSLAGRVTGSEALWTTGAHLIVAGVAMGFVAAIPGLVDYVGTVPPKSSAKGRAAKHGMVNAAALVLFGTAWWIQPAGAPPTLAVLGIQAVGLAFMTAGGWMGGTLVNRNFIGPDHRYADAGKWSETTLPAGNGVMTVAAADELTTNQMKLVHVGDLRIVVGRTEEGWVAFDDQCSHRGGSLAGGVLIGGTVHCLWHGSQFDVSSGAVEAGPADARIRTYPVEEVNGEVRLRL